MKRFALFAVLLSPGLLCNAQTSTSFTYSWQSSSDGWNLVSENCSGSCSFGFSADGNPGGSLFFKVTGNHAQSLAYFYKTFTWEQLGVPPGTSVTAASADFDARVLSSSSPCVAKDAWTTLGVGIVDQTGQECTLGQIYTTTTVAADQLWTPVPSQGLRNIVNPSCSASNSLLTLQFFFSPDSGSKQGASCEIRGDNLKLTAISQ